MPYLRLLFFTTMAIYTALLIGLEATTSQQAVRPYFSDIEDVSPLFGINTTVSTFLLAGSALLMLFAASTAHHPQWRQRRHFMLSQGLVFGFLAADDRFQIHERIGFWLDISDSIVMMAWALIELACLALLFRPQFAPWRAIAFFASGVFLFGMMFVIDTFGAGQGFLRLSLEDLAKTWAGVMFLGAAWVTAEFHFAQAARAGVHGGASAAASEDDTPP